MLKTLHQNRINWTDLRHLLMRHLTFLVYFKFVCQAHKQTRVIFVHFVT